MNFEVHNKIFISPRLFEKFELLESIDSMVSVKIFQILAYQTTVLQFLTEILLRNPDDRIYEPNFALKTKNSTPECHLLFIARLMEAICNRSSVFGRREDAFLFAK